MKKEIITIAIIILSIGLSNAVCYYKGYKQCEKHYKQYYNATENMLDSIDGDYFMDVIMESDEYQTYIKAKEDL